MQRILVFVFTAIFLSLLFTQPAMAAETVKLGLAGPLTGDQGVFGELLKIGAVIAMEEWNEKGGVLGKKVEFIWGDDQHDPKQAVSVANKFVNEGVVGVVGHFNSSCSIPVSTIYARFDIPQITPASINSEFTDRGLKNVFRTCGRDDQQAIVAADFIVNTLKKTKIAVFHDKTTYGQGLADKVVGELKKLGVEPVFYTGVVQGDKDYTAVLTAAKQKGPEILYFGGIHPEAILLARQSRELGLNAVMFNGSGTFTQEFIEGAGPAAEGSYITFYPDPEKIEAAQPFIKKLKEKFPQAREISAFTINSYVAANILLEAIQATGSTDGKKLSDFIHKTRFNTAAGSIQFDEKGDLVEAPFVVWQVQNGKFVQIQEFRKK
ncbi:MAG TPA: branched-chain amino acid ABC transporter substrate-binding protein [Candidatus Limnocylindrales bacterium]|nr:branched-chain amino acid ABC transporter substrate-binding protein [Candidatus Limnocylindrales bacterium]